MWLDFWLPNGPIIQQLNLTELENLQLDPQDFNSQLQSIPAPTSDNDQIHWLPSMAKEYSHMHTMDYFSPPSFVFAWTHLIWFKHYIPKDGFIAWLALKERLATLDTKPMMKKHYTNACYLCLADCEAVDHLFFKCKFSSTIWDYVLHAVGFYIKPDSWRDLIAWCSST
ncbi:uncharacterized protein LOC132309768 [Cornus florida]|uniref:uncharacterized protein LOC132309768 n=1 Tax=Cornus florida TaxID=4283 RepID=UPI0028A2233C|nr:uncharacterized protein LOC132309768 [Cornus florida]